MLFHKKCSETQIDEPTSAEDLMLSLVTACFMPQTESFHFLAAKGKTLMLQIAQGDILIHPKQIQKEVVSGCSSDGGC